MRRDSAIRAWRTGTSHSSRDASCSVRVVTGSARSGLAAHSACDDRGTVCRASLAASARSPVGCVLMRVLHRMTQLSESARLDCPTSLSGMSAPLASPSAGGTSLPLWCRTFPSCQARARCTQMSVQSGHGRLTLAEQTCDWLPFADRLLGRGLSRTAHRLPPDQRRQAPLPPYAVAVLELRPASAGAGVVASASGVLGLDDGHDLVGVAALLQQSCHGGHGGPSVGV